MTIGIDEEDLLEGSEVNTQQNDTPNQNTVEQEPQQPTQEVNEPIQAQTEGNEEDVVTLLLKSKGIQDSSKIKFENEEGTIEELDWSTLSNEEKLNILSSSTKDPGDGLDESEVQLINAIRNSGMSTSEYLQYLEEQSIDRYIQNSQGSKEYTVDQYSDDELFIADFMSRMGDVTDEEAKEALESAKANPTLFAKQIQAIRTEYKTMEDDTLRQQQMEQEELQQAQFDQFSQAVAEEINGLTEFGGYDLNLEEQDMQDIYDFITGTDAAGNNYFAKALSDPKILVQTALLTLNGEQMIDDITKYFQKEITKVRQESYNKGLEDAKKNVNSQGLVFVDKPNQNAVDVYNDLDDF